MKVLNHLQHLNPALNHYGTKTRVKFTGSCLKQSKITYTYKKIVSIYIVYEIKANVLGFSFPTLENCLFGAVTLTKNDIDKCRYSAYGNGFDTKGSFSFPGGGFGRNVIVFGADMNSSIHVDNKGKDTNIRIMSNRRVR